MPEPRRYAEGTDVPVVVTRAQIEALLEKHGATAIGVLRSGGRWQVIFELEGRRVRFAITMPRGSSFLEPADKSKPPYRMRTEKQAEAAYCREERRLWRALLLVIKSRFEAAASGVETWESAFMAHIVLPDGRTVGEHAAPRIAAAYRDGTMPALLPDYGKGNEDGR